MDSVRALLCVPPNGGINNLFEATYPLEQLYSANEY